MWHDSGTLSTHFWLLMFTTLNAPVTNYFSLLYFRLNVNCMFPYLWESKPGFLTFIIVGLCCHQVVLVFFFFGIRTIKIWKAVKETKLIIFFLLILRLFLAQLWRSCPRGSGSSPHLHSALEPPWPLLGNHSSGWTIPPVLDDGAGLLHTHST